MFVTKTLTGRGVWNIHTYFNAWRLLGKLKSARNPHRERGFGSEQRELCCCWNAKALTGRGVLKCTTFEISWLLSEYVCMLNFKTPLPVWGFSKPLSLWGFFQNPSPCEEFFKTAMYVCMYAKHVCMYVGFFETTLPVKGLSKPLCLWRVFQNTSPCEGFFKTPLPVKGFSKPLSLWRVFQNPSPCEGFFKTHPYVCMYAKHTGIQKLKKSSFDQALRNASKQIRKQTFGHTFWSRQGVFGLQLLKTSVFLFINQTTLTGRGILNIHTHLRVAALLSKSPLPVRVFDRLSYVCMYVC